jgi:hypothetical protein
MEFAFSAQDFRQVCRSTCVREARYDGKRRFAAEPSLENA